METRRPTDELPEPTLEQYVVVTRDMPQGDRYRRTLSWARQILAIRPGLTPDDYLVVVCGGKRRYRRRDHALVATMRELNKGLSHAFVTVAGLDGPPKRLLEAQEHIACAIHEVRTELKARTGAAPIGQDGGQAQAPAGVYEVALREMPEKQSYKRLAQDLYEIDDDDFLEAAAARMFKAVDRKRKRGSE